MVTSNPQTNFYAGPDSLKQYYDPEVAPPLPLVEIPECLNPYRQNGVRIYAKMMTMLPAHNVKALPGMHVKVIDWYERNDADLDSVESAVPSVERHNGHDRRVQLWFHRHLHVNTRSCVA